MPSSNACFGQLRQRHGSKLRRDPCPNGGFDPIGGLAATAFVIGEVISHSSSDRVGSVERQEATRLFHRLLLEPITCPCLSLRKAEHSHPIRVACVISRTQSLVVLPAVLIPEAGNPG